MGRSHPCHRITYLPPGPCPTYQSQNIFQQVRPTGQCFRNITATARATAKRQTGHIPPVPTPPLEAHSHQGLKATVITLPLAMVNLMCQLGRATLPRYLTNIILDVSMKVF